MQGFVCGFLLEGKMGNPLGLPGGRRLGTERRLSMSEHCRNLADR